MDSYYDDISKGYNALHQEEQLKKIHIVLYYLRRQQQKEGTVLDVGCGTGFSLDILSKELERPCVGVDPSKGMLSQYTGQQETKWAGAEELPFGNETFSTIVSFTAVQNFEDINKGLAEIWRVAQKEADIVITCLKKSPHFEEVSKGIAETFTVENVEEEDKDIIFFCSK